MCAKHSKKRGLKGLSACEIKDKIMIYAEVQLPGADRLAMSQVITSAPKRTIFFHFLNTTNKEDILHTACDFFAFLNISCHNQVKKELERNTTSKL